MLYHIIAFVIGFVVDMILGDPYWLYHPIRLIGNLIAALEKKMNKESYSDKKRLLNGRLLVVIVVFTTLIVVSLIVIGAYLIHPYLGLAIESIMTYQILATKCLKVESMKVYKALKTGDIVASRKAVSMIVGRDTENLTEEGVAKAAVETVAENTSDGVIAPMICLAIGGPILGFVYKAINTMDSMVGYKNDRYLNFGKTAAKLDDIANYLPARISAWIMILATGVLSIFSKIYNMKNAARIYKRDRYNHASPNSAQTEAVCAGALGLQLAGDAVYFGKVHKKPFIGDASRAIEPEDIRRANALLYGTAIICEIICLAIMIIICMITRR